MVNDPDSAAGRVASASEVQAFLLSSARTSEAAGDEARHCQRGKGRGNLSKFLLDAADPARANLVAAETSNLEQREWPGKPRRERRNWSKVPAKPLWSRSHLSYLPYLATQDASIVFAKFGSVL